MASVSALRAKDGTITWRVRFARTQRTFNHKKGADQFAALVEKIGPEAAIQVLEARQESVVPTLREWTEKYLDPASGLLVGIEPGTRDGYRRAAKNSWLITLGEYPLDTIQKEHVGQWLAWQERQPSKRSGGKTGATVAPKTIRNYHSLLSSVFASAVDKGLRTDNPAYKTRLTKGLAKEAVFLSPDEFSTILYFIPDYYEGLFVFLANSGCRWGEATALTWGRVNTRVNPATVRIEQAWKKSDTGSPVLKQPKTRKSRRTISIPPDAVAALGKPGRSDELVFKGPLSGKHLWYGPVRERVWERAVAAAMDEAVCEEAGLTVLGQHPTIHDLRHSHASWLIADNKPLPYIQARLGHENITTTIGTYGHLVPDANQQLADSIGTTLAGTRHIRVLREIEA